MLVEIKKLNIVNEGYRRKISLDKIFVNVNHVISIRDYDGASEFLISEGSPEYAKKQFCIVSVNYGKGTEDIIALGTSDEVFSSFRRKKPKKRILNG